METERDEKRWEPSPIMSCCRINFRLRRKTDGQGIKKEVEIWSGENNTIKETESLSQKPPGWCHVTLR